MKEDIEPEEQSKKKKYFASFYQNLMNGIIYYHGLYGKIGKSRDKFENDLFNAKEEPEALNCLYEINTEFMRANNKMEKACS